jgi:hypothetical protein
MRNYPANTAEALAMNFEEYGRPKSKILKKFFKKSKKKIIEVKLPKKQIKNILGTPSPLTPTVDDWAELAKINKVFPAIIRYVKNYPNVFTWRSWKLLDNMLKSKGVKHLTDKKLDEIVWSALILQRSPNE